MKSESQLTFLQKITRKLAQAFSEVNSMCLAEIANMRASINDSDEVAEQEQELVENPEALVVAEVEDVVEQEKQTDKEAKTKRIRKEEDAQNRMKKKGKKVSNKPKAPPSSFLIFFKQQQPVISKSYPTYGVTELTKVAAQCWKDLSNEEKEPYIQKCDEQRKIYQEKMIKYRIDFPEEIAERQKSRKQPRKDNKKGIKDTPRKEIGVVSEPEVIQQQIPLEQSQSLSEQNPDDSLGFL